MSIDAHVSVRPTAELERLDALGSAPAHALDRLFADTDLVLNARALLVRATSPLNRSAGRTILGDHIARMLASVPSAALYRDRLEAFALAEQLLDPIARLTSSAEAPLRPTISWSQAAPDAARELGSAIDGLRDRVETPHLVALIALFDALLGAADESAWARVEALAGQQNALAIESDEAISVFVSLFWTEHGTAWPAIYLVEKSRASKSPALEHVASFFASLEPGRAKPAVCFATNLIFSPSKADANAFALHNQAALVFEVVDAERRAKFARLASELGVDPAEAEDLARVFIAGHEFGHKYDPLNLPKWTEELFADVAAVVSCSETLSRSLSPEAMIRMLLLEALLNYGRPLSDPGSALYFDSTDQILSRLLAHGAIRVGERGSVEVDVDADRWSKIVEDFRASFASMRAGVVPCCFAPGVPALAPLHARIASLISSEKI